MGLGNGDYIKHCHNHYNYVAPTTECQTDGEVIDVTSNVQNAVAQGATSFFLFDNAQNPGGIFGLGGNLLSQINDPAPGYVKTVFIEYNNGCGSERTIKAMEYDHINLVTGTVTPASTPT